MSVLITKADGETEAYNPNKLLESLTRAGAGIALAHEIGGAVERELYQGITTQEIYRRAFARLREARRPYAARYSLKRAVLDLGPSGFPFEAFVAELYRAEGYTAKIDQIIQGACVEHEVDVVLEKGGATTYVEAKFHNSLGFKTDLKVTLYVKARLDDIAEARGAHGPAITGLIATNTKFTDKAEQFASCAGVALLGWDHPHGNNLHQKIEKTGLYPITALTSLSRREKESLLMQKVVLCKGLGAQSEALSVAGITGRRLEEVLKEAGDLCAGDGTVQ